MRQEDNVRGQSSGAAWTGRLARAFISYLILPLSLVSHTVSVNVSTMKERKRRYIFSKSTIPHTEDPPLTAENTKRANGKVWSCFWNIPPKLINAPHQKTGDVFVCFTSWSSLFDRLGDESSWQKGKRKSCCQGYTQSRKDNTTNSLNGSRQFRCMPNTQTIPGEIASTKDSRKTKHSTTQI